jgi:hypothetical protein
MFIFLYLTIFIKKNMMESNQVEPKKKTTKKVVKKVIKKLKSQKSLVGVGIEDGIEVSQEGI